MFKKQHQNIIIPVTLNKAYDYRANRLLSDPTIGLPH